MTVSHTLHPMFYIYFFKSNTVSVSFFLSIFFYLSGILQISIMQIQNEKNKKNNDDLAIIAIDTELNPYHSHKLHHHKNINNFPTWYQPCVTSFWKHHVIWLFLSNQIFPFVQYCDIVFIAVWPLPICMPCDLTQ